MTFFEAFTSELEKISQHPADLPIGSRYRSKGKGRGEARGGGYGPMGVPVQEKRQTGKEMAEDLNTYIVRAGGDVKAGVKAYNEARRKARGVG